MELYKDAAAPVADRVRDLLGRMTLVEKVGQVNQRMYGWNAYERTEQGHRLTDAFRDEVTRFGGMGALYGLQRADPWSGVTFADGITAADGARVSDMVQRHVVEESRLGIPVLMVEEVPHGHQALDGTVLPVNLAVGATWDPELYREAAAAAAAELRARGGHVALVSALDLVRDPRWGRSEECFGEDPYLAARLTEALVSGMQGTGDTYGPGNAAVVLKHFAGQGSSVGGRNSAATEIGARELHEIHLPAALAGVRAGAAGLMAAYNEFDGLPCAASRELLTALLRERWGFDGLVMADGCALDRLVRLTGDRPSAAALALSAGTDLSLWDEVFPELGTAVERGLVPVEALDAAVSRVLALKFRLGLFEHSYAGDATQQPSVTRELSAGIARASVTLLHNDAALLPLSPAARIAVVGPNADSIPQQIGDYTAPQRAGSGVSVLAGLREAGAEVSYARGCDLVGDDTSGIAEAVELAAAADVAVLVLGGSSAREHDTVFDANGAAIVATGNPTEMTCGEGVDLADVRLGAGQRALVDAVTATGTPCVAVLVQGRPHAVPELAEKAGALVSAWYPGPWGGRAVADVLLGACEPAGRLPVSVPRSSGQLPVFYNSKDHGYGGYVDEPVAPLYPFGHGLSYTTTEFGAPRVADGVCEVEVVNTGRRPVRETVQLYVRRVGGATSWPRVRELRGFRRIDLAPGERATVAFPLDDAVLASVTRSLDLAVEPGTYAIETGRSSADTRSTTLTVGPPAVR
ncbi:glycoside hydrolase family 3 N-terminal domain-containing protein [Streptomyces sp. NPDC006422]|uniref:glycoside hydrolase family 3 N-terminal domain-containing protein n=1 Tax=unclassified Streptomyces TaxID=2593676 RepID=UPI0033B010B2